MIQVTLVRLCLKNPDSYVKYQLSKPFTVEETVRINDINFHIPTLIEEVKQLPKSKIKQYKRQIQTFLVTASSFTMLPLRSMASSVTATQTVTSLPQSATGIPPELLELLLMILKISVGGAVILAAILLVMNAIGKMFRIK